MLHSLRSLIVNLSSSIFVFNTSLPSIQLLYAFSLFFVTYGKITVSGLPHRFQHLTVKFFSSSPLLHMCLSTKHTAKPVRLFCPATNQGWIMSESVSRAARSFSFTFIFRLDLRSRVNLSHGCVSVESISDDDNVAHAELRSAIVSQ